MPSTLEALDFAGPWYPDAPIPSPGRVDIYSATYLSRQVSIPIRNQARLLTRAPDTLRSRHNHRARQDKQHGGRGRYLEAGSALAAYKDHPCAYDRYPRSGQRCCHSGASSPATSRPSTATWERWMEASAVPHATESSYNTQGGRMIAQPVPSDQVKLNISLFEDAAILHWVYKICDAD